jgi:Ser/Thr protein kinase RdoA (MazF antagonist)
MTATKLAHGMGTELVAPDWAPLTIADVDGVLRHYEGLGACRGLAWHSPRPFSSAGIAETGAGPLFVKRYHRLIRDVAGFAEEHRFIAHLRAAGASVPEVLAARGGATAVAEGDWVYEVQRIGPGEDLYRDALSWSPFRKPAHARAAGRALAELHRAAAGYDAPPRGASTLVASFTLMRAADPLRAIADYAAARPALGRYLARRDWRGEIGRSVLPFHRRLLPFIGRLAPLWTHNDWHASNLLWRGDEVSAVLDFGLADRTSALHDLATAIERNVVRWLDLAGGEPVDYPALDALIDGYRAVTTLAAWERQALAALLPVVHVEFALNEADYFLAALDAPERADLAYDTYLLGHADWFAGARGQKLLARIGGDDVAA